MRLAEESNDGTCLRKKLQRPISRFVLVGHPLSRARWRLTCGQLEVQRYCGIASAIALHGTGMVVEPPRVSRRAPS